MTLPRHASKGQYILKVYLYNLSEKLPRDLLHLADMKDFGIFTNDTFETGAFYLYPPNNHPATPRQLLGSIFHNIWFFSGENL